MAFVPLAETVEVVLSAERNGEERKNIIHYRYTGALPTEAEMESLALGVQSTIIQAQKALSCIGTNWIEIKVSEMSTAGGLVHSKSIFEAGVAMDGVLPGNSSHCLTKRTGFRGASFRGRFYLFDLPEDYFNGDDVELVMLPWATAIANALLTPHVSGKFLPAVGSEAIGGSTLINAITFDLVADSQRRRLKKRGR